MKVKPDKIICFGIGVFLGALIWGFSPVFTGEPEPWDGGAYYWVSLFFSGAIGYLVYPRSLLMTIVGIYLGQILGLIISGVGPLWFVGVVLMAFYSLIA